MSLLLLLLVLLPGSVRSLLAEPLFQFHTLTKKNGLASSVVYDIAQDKDGFVWFATEDGLQKFDGFNLDTYRHSRKEKESISNNVVRVLLVDKSGSLWVGTEKGVNVYQKDFDNFKHYQAKEDNNTGLISNNIRALHQTDDGNIWIGSSDGLSVFNQQTKQITSYPQYPVRAIFEDEHKQLWIGTLRGGLFLFDRNKESFVPVQTQVPEGAAEDTTSNNNLSIVDIFQDSFGRIMAATWGDGIFVLQKDVRQLVQYKVTLPSEYVRSIFQDEKGQYWIGTLQGLVVYEPTEGKSRHIVASDRNDRSLFSNNIFGVFQSDDDTIWVGTYGGGVSRHHPISRRFESYGLHPDESEGLVDPSVFSFYEAKNNDVWIGSETGKVSLFDPSTKKFKHYEIVLDGKKNTAAVGVLYQLTPDILLVGTINGIYKFHINTLKTERFSATENLFLSEDLAPTFIQKDRENRLWVGIRDKGIGIFDVGENGELVEISSLRVPIIQPERLIHLLPDESLVATMNDGLYRLYENKADKIIRQEKIEGLDGLSITDISVDWKERIWIATWSSGIKILNKTGRVITIDEVNGLPNNSVYSVVADETSNKMWASTNLGMVSIDIDSHDISHFRASDGLQGDEFNSPGMLSENGHLYFGGVNGFNRFYPNILEYKLEIKNPIVTELSIANKKVKIMDSTQKIITRSLRVTNEINLNYDQTPFSLSFTSPQFIRPESIEFRYRLLGLSDDWIIAPKGLRRATYTNLNAGDYSFELQVKGASTIWKSSIEPFSITIAPPWWKTTLAKFIYFMAVLLLLSSVLFYFYLKRKKEKLVQLAIQENEERLKLSLWGSGYEFWDWNLESGEISRSNEFKKIQIDCPKIDRNLQQIAGYIHPSDLAQVREQLNRHISGNSKYFDLCYRIVDAKNGWRWIQDRGKVVAVDSNGSALRMSGTQRDITHMRQRDEQFEMLGQAFRSTSDGVWIRDNEWRLVECNPAFERITGFSLNEKKGEALWFPDLQEQPENILQRIRISIEEKGNWQGEAWAERKNNDPFPQKLSIDTLHDEKGNIRYYVGVFSDITFHKRTEEEFRKLANYDSLTGLPNRACLFDRLNQTIEKSKRDKGRFALFLIDIDNFKRINDSMGHNIGDVLIQQISARLVNCNKEGDTVSRIGGDEFVIVVDKIKSSTAVATFSELLLKELNQPIFIKGQQLKLNFSIGISLAPDDGMVAERLMRNADTAMYEAKKSVENSYRFYSVEFNERAKKRLELENALRRSIEDETIELYYQPKVDLSTGLVDGVEALARWTHKNLGFISPAEFIPLAEDTGLIIPLGKMLFKQAVLQTKEWVTMGIMRGSTSVNLSAHQFWNRNLATEITQILKDADLQSQYIELEITESACMQDMSETIAQINALKKLGFSLALDDFGTGYSSLAQLKALPFDTLKVDKSFVDNIETNNQDAKVVKAIIDIAKTMEMKVVIEGVESKTQCEYLWMNRAYCIQGYYFSRPVKAELIPELLQKQWNRDEYLGNIGKNVTPLGSLNE